MNSFLEIALACIARDWYVFPCWPKTKDPLNLHAHKDASNDEAQVRAWWTRTPDANVAVATGPSGITVLDVDSGLDGEDSLALSVRLTVSRRRSRYARESAALSRSTVFRRGLYIAQRMGGGRVCQRP